MSKFLISITAFILLANPSLYSRTITVDEAGSIARKWMSKSNSSIRTRTDVNSPLQMAYVATETSSEEPTLWVFNYENQNGYVVVAADDRVASPVLGYSENAVFDSEVIPENLRWWLGEYSRQIEFLRENPQLEQNYTRSFGTDVAPLVTTRWNQSKPYNLLCPELDGKLSVTGCVATATAQLMYFHKYPQIGTGSITYYWTKGNTYLSSDFSKVTFDWDNMINVYNDNATDVQNNAVAVLMKNVGYACQMNYSPSASGAQSANAGRALVNNFKYAADIRVLQRDYTSLSEFENAMVEELMAGRPLYYSGSTVDRAGHAYVCDGFNKDGYFHINWGWGGLSDGYFLTTALGPDAQGIGGASDAFNYGQNIFLNIRPGDGTETKNYFLGSTGGFKSSTSSATVGNNARFYLEGAVYNYSLWEINYKFGISISDSRNTVVKTYFNSSSLNSKPLYGYRNLSVTYTIPNTLPDGTYTVRPVFCPTESEIYDNVHIAVNERQYVIMTIENGSVKLASPSLAKLAADKFAHQPLDKGKKYSIDVDIENSGDTEFYGNLKLCFYNEASSAYSVAESDIAVADLAAGEKQTISFVGIAPENGGDYLMVVVDGNNNTIGSQSVSIDKGPAVITADKSSVIENPDTKTVKYICYLSNSGSTFEGNLLLGFYKSVDGKQTLLKTYEKEVVLADTDGTKEFTFEFSPENAEPGVSYTCILMVEIDGKRTEITQRRTRKTFVMTSTAGVDDIFATDSECSVKGMSGAIEVSVAKPVTVRVYNAGGYMVAHSQIDSDTSLIDVPAGFYIVRIDNGYTAKVIVR